MAQPTPYNKATDFTNLPDEQIKTKLDIEFTAAELTLDQTLAKIALIQRDDGALANQIVTADSLGSEVLALLTMATLPRGAWVTATAYAQSDIVSQTNGTYLCIVAHTSGTFATDLAAGKWILLASTSASDAIVALSALSPAANKLPYFTSTTAAALADLSAAGRALVDDADAAAQRATLGSTSVGDAVFVAANAAAARQAIGAVIGTDVQAYDAELAALAGLTSAANKLPYFTGSGAAALADMTAAGRALLDDADAAAQLVTLGTAIITPWVKYTPTFTGFGTAASVDVFSRRVGDTLEIRGYFVTGTGTAVEARMTMGFAGVDGGLTSNTAKVPTLQLAGKVALSINSAASFVILIESGTAYITFGVQSSTTAGLTKALGNSFGTTTGISFNASTPITGW